MTLITSTVQGFVGTILGLEPNHQISKESNNSFIMPPHQAVELTPVGQGGESRTQAAAGVAVEASLAGETVPLAEEGQGDHLAAVQRGPGARSLL